MAKLENIILKFQCKNCLGEVSEMTAQELMEAGTEGPPYCNCDEELEVTRVFIREEPFM